MDQITLQKIARLRTLAARRGVSLDVLRMAIDRPYAQRMLAVTTAVGGPELQSVSETLRQLLQLTSDAPGLAPVPPPSARPQVTARI